MKPSHLKCGHGVKFVFMMTQNWTNMCICMSQSASGLCGFSCPTASSTLSWHLSDLAYGPGRAETYFAWGNVISMTTRTGSGCRTKLKKKLIISSLRQRLGKDTLGHPLQRGNGQSPGETLRPSDQSDGFQPPRRFQPAKGVAIPSATV